MAANSQAAPAPAGRRLPHVPAATWQIPRHYFLTSIIGQGSYGTVCEAEDRSRNRVVAIKQVRDLFRNLEDSKRTLRELSIVRQLDHECVVRFYDAFLPRTSARFDEIYIVMEIGDSDMRKLIRTDVTLSMQHLTFLLYNLLRGLKYLGSAGVIHRDLTPGNILVNLDCSVKICDFNLACVLDDGAGGHPQALEALRAPDAAVPELTGPMVPRTSRATRQLTQRVVTRWYRAPEVILLQRGYTKAIDMWSAGCVFGELVQTLEGGPQVEDRSPIFPGSHAFPLSPRPARQERGRRASRDMLGLIFELLGTPSEEELGNLDREDAQRYVRGFPASEGRGLQARLPWVEGPAADILARMLRFDAPSRLGASEALGHELFAEMRSEEAEKAAAAPISLDIEQEGVVDEPCLRRHFLREAQQFAGTPEEATVGGA